MGIPHLTRYLLPLSEPVYLGDSSPPGTKRIKSVVIDGPSLVYHVYFRLLSWTDAHFNALDAQPTCEEVSIGVMIYLFQLRNLNIEM